MKRIILIALSLILCFLVGCNAHYKTVDVGTVTSASVWTYDGRYELNDEELAELIKLYNSSRYKGKATGDGGTPEFGASISFENGEELCVNEFGGKYGDFEAFYNAKKAFYIDNEELLSFVEKLCEDNIE